MFRRLEASLFKPRNIGDFITDKLVYVILYILFFSMLAHAPSLVKEGMKNEISNEFHESLIRTLRYGEFEGNIEDYKYVGDVNKAFMISEGYIVALIPEAKNYGTYITFIFEEESLSVYYTSKQINSYTYEELELENLDFNLGKKSERDQLKTVFDKVYNDNKKMSFLYVFITEFILGIATVFIFTLIISIIGVFDVPKMFFKYRYRLAAYSSVIYTFGILFSELFDIYILQILAVIMSFIYMRVSYISANIKILKRKGNLEEDE